MSKKRILTEVAVARALNATDSAEVKDLIHDFTEESFGHYRADARNTSVDVAYGIARAKRQILFSALNELACRQVVANVSSHLDSHGSLTSGDDYNHGQLFDTHYKNVSPRIRTFLTSLHFWFRPPLERVIADGHNGLNPAAAIMRAAPQVNDEFKEAFTNWTRHSNQPYARRINPSLQPNFEMSFRNSLVGNLREAAGLLIGRGVAHSFLKTDQSKAQFSLSQLEQINNIGSISGPILRGINDIADLMQLYTDWELNKITGQEFFHQALPSPLTSADASPHKSLKNGAWSDRRHCSADVRFMRLGEFSVAPEALLRKITGAPAPPDISMNHIFLGAGIVIAKDTIFEHWPAYPLESR